MKYINLMIKRFFGGYLVNDILKFPMLLSISLLYLWLNLYFIQQLITNKEALQITNGRITKGTMGLTNNCVYNKDHKKDICTRYCLYEKITVIFGKYCPRILDKQCLKCTLDCIYGNISSRNMLNSLEDVIIAFPLTFKSCGMFTRSLVNSTFYKGLCIDIMRI